MRTHVSESHEDPFSPKLGCTVVNRSEPCCRELPPSKKRLGSQGPGRPVLQSPCSRMMGPRIMGHQQTTYNGQTSAQQQAVLLFPKRVTNGLGENCSAKPPQRPQTQFLGPHDSKVSLSGEPPQAERVICKTVRGVWSLLRNSDGF